MVRKRFLCSKQNNFSYLCLINVSVYSNAKLPLFKDVSFPTLFKFNMNPFLSTTRICLWVVAINSVIM